MASFSVNTWLSGIFIFNFPLRSLSLWFPLLYACLHIPFLVFPLSWSISVPFLIFPFHFPDLRFPFCDLSLPLFWTLLNSVCSELSLNFPYSQLRLNPFCVDRLCFQHEGAEFVDYKSENIWDVYARRDGKFSSIIFFQKLNCRSFWRIGGHAMHVRK